MVVQINDLVLFLQEKLHEFLLFNHRGFIKCSLTSSRLSLVDAKLPPYKQFFFFFVLSDDHLATSRTFTNTHYHYRLDNSHNKKDS